MPRDDSSSETPVPARGSWKRRLGSWLAATLWLIGLAALALAGWTWADTHFYQLQHLGQSVRLEGLPAPDLGPEPPLVIEPGTPIAEIEIPRIGLSPVVVAEGVSAKVLRRAVGHLPSSARPGEQGNVVLAGHRDTFFAPLAEIRAGDVIVLESQAGREVYEVEWTRVVEPTAVEVTRETDYPALTLITCYPFRYVGNAPQRFIVRARRMAAAAI